MTEVIPVSVLVVFVALEMSVSMLMSVPGFRVKRVKSGIAFDFKICLNFQDFLKSLENIFADTLEVASNPLPISKLSKISNYP